MVIDSEGLEEEAHCRGYAFPAGIDEAGRGPLAGPVVAAAVVFPRYGRIDGLNDSKKLTARRRDQLFDVIYEKAVSVGIGIVDPLEIDRLNILQAALLAMEIAVDNLCPAADYLLVDGTFPIKSLLPQNVVKQGDGRCRSIAAASIVAKVTRDRMMGVYDREYPEFGFGRHKGYGTQAHCAAIRLYGCCPIHRKSFRRVREYV